MEVSKNFKLVFKGVEMQLNKKFKLGLTKDGKVLITTVVNLKWAIPFWSVDTQEEAMKLVKLLKVKAGNQTIEDVFKLAEQCKEFQERK